MLMKRWAGLVAGLVMLAASVRGQMDDPFGVEASAVAGADGGRELVVRVTVPAGHYLYAKDLAVSVAGGTLIPLAVPKPKAKLDPFLEETVDVFAHDMELRYRLEAPVDAVVKVAYMGCSQQLCFMPQSREFRLGATGEVANSPAAAPPDAPAVSAPAADAGVFAGLRLAGREAGYMPAGDFLAFLQRVDAGQGMQRGRVEQIVDKHGLWIGVLAILLFGVMLNLTPCVLPMIPVNLAIIGAGAQAGSRQRGFLLGAVYGLAIALVYGALGLVVVLTGAQFGQLNASPWFNLGIAALFVGLALAMLGVFNLDFSRFQSGGLAARKHGQFVTAFVFGGVAALLAGACVAPVVISVLVLATEFYQRGSQGALLLPFVLGLGMALPWPFAGAGLALLPKPGRWMERVKMGFGAVILLAAVYYGYLGITLLRASSLATQDAPAVSVSGDFWQTSPAAAVAEARRSGLPLFIDVWATWCKNCKAMDATTLKDPSVLAALEPYVRLKFQAEHLGDPATRQVLEALGVRGLPSYVVMEVDK